MLHVSQPTDENILKGAFCFIPNFKISLPSCFIPSRMILMTSLSSEEGIFSFLQDWQRRRTKRWAMERDRAETMIFGFTPRSIKRGIVPAALLVWRVEKTMCPVRADWTAILDRKST